MKQLLTDSLDFAGQCLTYAWLLFVTFLIGMGISMLVATPAQAVMARPGSAMTTTCTCSGTGYVMSPYTGGGLTIFSRMFAM